MKLLLMSDEKKYLSQQNNYNDLMFYFKSKESGLINFSSFKFPLGF